MTIVNDARSTQVSNIDRKKVATVAIASDEIDAGLIQHIRPGIAALAPAGTTVAPLDGKPLRDLNDAGNAIASAQETRQVLAAYAATTRFDAGDRLLLIVPERRDIRFEVRNGKAGSGDAAGIGIFIDMRDLTEEGRGAVASPGMLGLFANVKLVLVDATSGKTIAVEHSADGVSISGRRSPDFNPWNAVSAAEKLDKLKSLLAHSVDRMLPRLFAR